MLSSLSPRLLPSFSFRASPPRLPMTLRLKPPQLLSGRRRFLLPVKASDDNDNEENFDGALYLLPRQVGNGTTEEVKKIVTTLNEAEVPSRMLLVVVTTEEVKKIVTTLNEAEVPSEDVVEVVVSPPFVFLNFVKSLLRSDFHVAAQNCWVRKGGAFTGEISAEMLVNLSIP
ncbi:hypothetical protein V6N12_072060 [Hibiscus sabdariffa]|uniref:Uncharacterized protein n=1 Tax=Hibiscus sabdariffa TaxID=183260 RepID=A0ABR2FLN2_9ROSI